MKKVIVIGSGFAGLTAASVLASRGCKVILFEKNDQPGGRARTFSASGFTFDMGPSWYWMPDVFDSFFEQFDRRVSDYYDLKRLDPSYRLFFGPDEILTVPDSRDELCRLFESLERGSSRQLERFLQEAAYKYEIGMRNLVYKPGNSFLEFMNYGLLRGLVRMHVFRSLSSYVRRFFTDTRLVQLMEFPVLFLGGTPENTPALYSLMNHAALSLGTWYPLGGMSQIVEAMLSLAQSLGVEFHPSAQIDRIVVRRGKSEGVQLNGQFHAADAVVAAADYHHVERDLLEPEWRAYSQAYWNSRVMAPSSLIFYLGVDRKLNRLQHHNLFFDEDFALHAHEIYNEPQWPTKPLFYVCCPSKTDESVAPNGFENLFVLVPIAAGLQDTDEVRETYYERILARLEKNTQQAIAPHVIFKRSYSLNNFVQDYHAFRGNAYGLANTLKQTAIFKPSLRSKKVENLFFAGQLTVPGPGVPPSIISGQVAAAQVLNFLQRAR